MKWIDETDNWTEKCTLHVISETWVPVFHRGMKTWERDERRGETERVGRVFHITSQTHGQTADSLFMIEGIITPIIIWLFFATKLIVFETKTGILCDIIFTWSS